MPSATTSARTRDSQSIIPLVQPKWKRSVTSKDVLPSPSLNRGDGGVCSVCGRCEWRYKCPRCQIPYCSVACYKQHDDGTSSCTESFYHDRVSTVLQYEAKEKSQSMQQILNRCHQGITSVEQEDADLEEHVFDDDDLLRLAEALESGTMTAEDAESLMTPELRAEFERAVKSGELSTLIEPWHAWWMPELLSADQSPNIADTSIHRRTLDERLIKVPPFRTFRPGPLPDLTYNVVDLLYSIAVTLRLYHGVENAVSLCSESSQTLVGASAVLRNDARHASVAEALMSCTAASACAQQGCTASTAWTVFARDVMCMCTSQRHVSHALLEAIDIIKAAAKVMGSREDRNGASIMRLKKKKLEYYLSWSREATLPEDLENEIRTWIDEWKGENDSEIDTLMLPKTTEPTRSILEPATRTCDGGRAGHSFLKEVSSTRKTKST